MSVVEISLDSLDSALAAQAGGAHRIELCSALSEGGVTPSLGLLRAVRAACGLSLQVLIRPRAGDFLYSDTEFEIMQQDIRIAADAGADGVVLGLLTADGDVDQARTRELVELAAPLETTFHRAIDMARDPLAAVDEVVRCGATRILTSGAASSAPKGEEVLASMMRLAAGRLTIMAGGGVRPGNVAALAQSTDITNFHASLRHFLPSPMNFRRRNLHMGSTEGDEYQRSAVHADDVRALVQAAEQAVLKPTS